MGASKHTVNELDVLFTKERTLKQWIKDNQIGLYSTVIFHLLVFLGLALGTIQTKLAETKFVVLEFLPNQPEPEILVEENEKEKLEKELDRMLRDMPMPSVNTPNIVMNAAAQGSTSGSGQGGVNTFFTGRNTASLKNENEKKEQDERNKKQGADDVNNANQETSSEAGEAYKGPSIVSYFLEGRVAISMPVPAYKCKSGGDVTVLIEVNRLGYVVSAEVDAKNSSRDDCLHTAAIQAAMLARFSSSTLANQKGNIVYRFVPQ